LVVLNKEASKVGMNINQAKTKAMRINNKNTVTDLLKSTGSMCLSGRML
jgi:hypothetical protein